MAKYCIEITDKNGVVYLIRDKNAQPLLISGQNIKTINGNSILGSGDLVIPGGGSYSGGTGISITGNVINHSNAISAQATQAVYPIAIDAQGHVTSYGSAVSIPTKTSDLNNDSGFITSSDIPVAGTTATAVGTTSSGGSATTWSKSDHVHSIDSTTIVGALGYTPYDSSNPNGYLTLSDLPIYNGQVI